MADFPSSPFIGQTFTSDDGSIWTWDGSSWKSSSFFGGGGSSIPTHPADGKQYGLDATALGNPTLQWRLFADQSTFLTFAGSISATFANGPFSGTSTAEKGYTSTNVNFTFSRSNPTNFIITDSYNATLNSSPITYYGATGSGNTSNSTSGGSFRNSIVVEPATFGVTLKSNTNETSTVSTSLSWLYRIYWGVSSSTSLTETQIEALVSNALRSSRAGTFTFDASAGSVYLYFCYPTSFGAASQFTVNGFVTTFDSVGPVSVTNTYGATTNYYVYKSTNVQSGSGIPVVVS
jgi:hypothetical protein